MHLSKNIIEKFQKHILSWYAKNKREMPWREIPWDSKLHQRDPYKILVSEVMLQQTQVARVVPKYEAWIQRFPTLESLAKATTHDILSHWVGLGYNRRALYLQKFAKEVIQKYDGNIPREEKLLLKLPGIGPYTARALLCFAFNQQVVIIDTNIRKVILTQFLKEEKGTDVVKEQLISEIANKLLPEGKAYVWNQALMDYASVMLKQEKIPIPKQSKFKNSDRFYRGKIVALLVQEKKMPLTVLEKLFQSELNDEKRFWKILKGLVKDKLVTLSQKDATVALS